MRKRRFVLFAVAALLIAGACSCSGGRGWGRKKPRYGGCRVLAECVAHMPLGVETWGVAAA